MMDYLTSLLARNLELMGGIQPRLASRFEPTSPTGGSATSDHILTTSPALPSERPLESHRTLRDSRDQSSNRRPVQAQGQPSSQGAAPYSVDPRDEEGAVQTRQELPPSHLDHLPGAPAHPGNLRFTGSKTLPGLPPEHAVVIPAAPDNPTLSGSSGSGRLEHRASSDQIILPGGAERTAPAEGGSGTQAPFLSPRRIAQPGEAVPPAHVTPSVQAASFSGVEPARKPRAAPVIRVSIGRVEVRAVIAPQAPSPPLRQPRSGPSLSLEDYLKERGGGKR